jgi:hypothetical protein
VGTSSREPKTRRSENGYNEPNERFSHLHKLHNLLSCRFRAATALAYCLVAAIEGHTSTPRAETRQAASAATIYIAP